VRHSGVTGIQLADETLGASYVTLYGYPFRLNYLAFAYLSNINTDSRSDGDLSVPAPADFNLAFDRLNLNCFGDVESLSLPSPAPELTLAYWSARVKPTTALFTSADPCAVGQKTLVMDISTEVDNLPGRLFGRIGVLANGNLACKNDNIGCDSRLTLPASVTLPGPNGASYTLRPASKGYFNDFRTCGDRAQTGDGLLTFAGEIDVPFFENLLVQGFTVPIPAERPRRSTWSAAGRPKAGRSAATRPLLIRNSTRPTRLIPPAPASLRFGIPGRQPCRLHPARPA
jgi:hypothetical protein